MVKEKSTKYEKRAMAGVGLAVAGLVAVIGSGIYGLCTVIPEPKMPEAIREVGGLGHLLDIHMNNPRTKREVEDYKLMYENYEKSRDSPFGISLFIGGFAAVLSGGCFAAANYGFSQRNKQK